MGDFLAPGYPLVKISFEAAPAIVEELDFVTKLSGDNEVPRVETRARGVAIAKLREEGTELRFDGFFGGLRKVTAAHLHLGAEGENGPVVALLIPEDLSELSRRARRRLRHRIQATLTADDLRGPLTGQPLDALSQAILDGNVYVNIHTEANPAGELRGQLSLY